MSLIRKNIILTEKQWEWVTSKIEEGLYENESELIRNLIRFAQDKEEDHKVLTEIALRK